MHLTKEQNQCLDSLITNLVYFVSKGSQKVTAEYLFNKIWTLLYNQLWMNGLNETIDLKEIDTLLYGRYQLNIRELLLLKIIVIFRKHGVNYSPNIIVKDVTLLNQIKTSHDPAIFVSTHNGFAHNIKVLTNIGRNVTTIGLPDYTNLALTRSDIQSNVNVVNQDRYCLAYVKKDIANGALIASTVDFNIDDQPFKYISPALFQFAKKLKVDLYFSTTEVLENGKVTLNFQLSPNSASPEETANQFIQYCTSGLSKKSLTVKDFKA